MTVTTLPSLVKKNVTITIKPCGDEIIGEIRVPHPIDIELDNGEIVPGYWNLVVKTRKEAKYTAFLKD